MSDCDDYSDVGGNAGRYRSGLIAAVLAVVMHVPLVWWWLQPTTAVVEPTVAVAMAMLPDARAEMQPEVSPEIPESAGVESAAEPSPEEPTAPSDDAMTSASTSALGDAHGAGDVATAPLSLTWPTGNALLDLAGAEGLVLLVLDGAGAPIGAVDAATGVFTSGLPAALQSGDWDPETRLLPYPPARVLASLAGQPRDHRVAVVVPRQRLAAWTAAAAGRQATFQRRGNHWQLH